MNQLNREAPDPRILASSACDIVSRIAAGEWSSRQVTETFITQVELVNPHLNALVVSRFDEARQEAVAADRARDQGAELGPLHGLPMTVKECFHLAGSSTTIGLTTRVNRPRDEDGVFVRRIREAGAIILGKTNVPQLILWLES